jgi:hypothetical protein
MHAFTRLRRIVRLFLDKIVTYLLLFPCGLVSWTPLGANYRRLVDTAGVGVVDHSLLVRRLIGGSL